MEGQRKEEGRIVIFYFGRKDELVISKSCLREPHGCPHGHRLPIHTLIRESLQVSFFFPRAGWGGIGDIGLSMH